MRDVSSATLILFPVIVLDITGALLFVRVGVIVLLLLFRRQPETDPLQRHLEAMQPMHR